MWRSVNVVCLSDYVSVCLSVCPCDYLSVRLATWQCVCLSDYLHVCLSVRVAVCCLPLDFSAALSYSSILILLLTLKLRRCSDMIMLCRRS